MGGLVVVVEDDDFIRDILATTLETEGYEVYTAPSAARAFGILEATTPDLVLLDLALPDEDGLTICRKLRGMQSLETLPVVFISAMSQPMYVQAAARAGGNAFIRKPFDIDNVLATVASFIAPKPSCLVEAAGAKV